MNAIAITKVCPMCGLEKSVDSFPRSKVQVLTYCKPCHNLRSQGYQRQPKNRAVHNAAKRRWDARNPERKRINEGRSVLLHKVGVPERLLRLERLVMVLGTQKGGVQ